jgi:hypothetical protein
LRGAVTRSSVLAAQEGQAVSRPYKEIHTSVEAERRRSSSDPVHSFTDIAGTFICDGACGTAKLTKIYNASYSFDLLR